MQTNYLVQFTNISEMILEKCTFEWKLLHEKRTCKKQSWIFPCYWTNIKRKIQKQLNLRIGDRKIVFETIERDHKRSLRYNQCRSYHRKWTILENLKIFVYG